MIMYSVCEAVAVPRLRATPAAPYVHTRPLRTWGPEGGWEGGGGGPADGLREGRGGKGPATSRAGPSEGYGRLPH